MARYIDADALIAEYDRVHIGPAGGARKLMVDAPTADVAEVKHGEWLHKKIDDLNYHVYGQCSNCLERKRIDNYCPNCGAKMDGKGDSE